MAPPNAVKSTATDSLTGLPVVMEPVHCIGLQPSMDPDPLVEDDIVHSDGRRGAFDPSEDS